MNIGRQSFSSALVTLPADVVLVGTLSFASFRPGYRHISNTISELGETGARMLTLALLGSFFQWADCLADFMAGAPSQLRLDTLAFLLPCPGCAERRECRVERLKKERFIEIPRNRSCARHYPELEKIPKFTQRSPILGPLLSRLSEDHVIENIDLEQLSGANEVTRCFDI